MTSLAELFTSQVAVNVAALAGLALTAVAILRDLQARRSSSEPFAASVPPTA